MTDTHFFTEPYQEYIAYSRYARWLPVQNRRETWEETVERYIDYFTQKFPDFKDDLELAKKSILSLEVMPSMRCLMTAGEALERNHIAGYNCSYLPIDHPRSFDEVMYILSNGTGVGFSVEARNVEKLPIVPYEIESPNDRIINVQDSKEGWARSLGKLIRGLYYGQKYSWDLSGVRPAGERLKTFGGRASGPEPLDRLFKKTVEIFYNARGRRLNTLECHDLLCHIATTIVVGGVRRSAMISLSDLSDSSLANCKTGQWWVDNPQRALANNSAVYQGTPQCLEFLKEWTSLIASGSGERGIFNRAAIKSFVKSQGIRDFEVEFGTNPCSEIILRPYQFCNLSEVVIREEDTENTLKRKIKIATLLGTLQGALTDFKYLRNVWKRNTEEERLLGVSLTGVFDNLLVHNKPILQSLKDEARNWNLIYSQKLGIPESKAITCVKPSGTVSQLVSCSSGLHPGYAKKYIRTVRESKTSPVSSFLKDQGIPCEDDVVHPDTSVFYFTQESKAKVYRKELSAVDHLKIWKKFQKNYCEHKPSVTIQVKDNEWLEVGSYVYQHFKDFTGVSFLPYDSGNFKQAPYQEVSEEEWDNLKSKIPVKIDWTKLQDYEKKDSTTVLEEISCSSGVCEI